MRINKQFKQLLFFIALFLLFYSPVKASTLNLESTKTEYFKNDTFIVEIKIDDVSNCVNAIEARIKFNQDDIQVVDFLIGASILNFWITQPDKETMAIANQVGELAFAGGTPGGYCGKIPGDPGRSNIIGKIVFKINELDNDKKTEINFGKSIALLNDGRGSVDELKLNGIELSLISEENDAYNDYENELTLDKIKPEPFVVELRQNKNLFNNQYHIIFSTVDKQTGIDRYEVLEIRSDEQVGEDGKLSLLDRLIGQKRDKVVWRIASMPYLLNDQTLESTVKVKAIDKSGNERQVSFIPPEGEREKIRNASYKNVFVLLSITGIILILIIILIFLIRKKSHVEKNKED
ncbi:hypothetical protein KAI92_03355 [Candidatus Parcubacteria bacterium]|nr:hypothetical protein [Candidatus Parcubacteria bacterium]